MCFMRLVFAALPDISRVEVGGRFSTRAYRFDEWRCQWANPIECAICAAYGSVSDMQGL